MNTEWVWRNKELSFGSCADLVSMQDKNYIIRKVNKAYADVFGMKPEEIIGKACYELVHGTKEPIARCPHRRTLETKKPVRERFFEPNMGAYLNVRTKPIFDKKGKFRGSIHIMKDVCECIRTRKSLEIERNMLQAITGTMEYGISIQNLDYEIIYQNKLLKNTFGRLGEKCYKVYEGKDTVCEGCPAEIVFKDGQTHASERRVTMPSGETAFWENVVVPIRDSSGKITSCLEIGKNITKRKLAEEALKKSEAKLKEQKASLEQKNVALKEILEQIGIEKNRIKEDVIANVEKVVLPIVEKLRIKGSSRKYVSLLQKSLRALTSSFGRKLTEKKAILTLREVEISNMIKNGLTSKEISGLLNISLRTSERHRFNIRKKLRIAKKDVNLASFLQQL